MIAAARRSEAGETLLEILIAVMVVGIGFVAVLGGLGTSFVSSAFHREQARAEAELRRYAEATKAASFQNSCAADAYASAVSFTPAADFTADAPVVVDYLDSSTGGPVSCSTATNPTDERPMQVVRLTVTSSVDTRAVETIDVVKRPT